MEYVAGGTLLDMVNFYRNLNENNSIFQIACEPNVIEFYASELLQALIFVHSKNVVHRDLNPRNVLITNTGHLKLADFGLALHFTIEDGMQKDLKGDSSAFVGTAEYISPEVC